VGVTATRRVMRRTTRRIMAGVTAPTPLQLRRDRCIVMRTQMAAKHIPGTPLNEEHRGQHRHDPPEPHASYHCR